MIPIALTTVTVQRPTANADAFETATYTTIARGVPGTVSSVGGSEALGNGSQETVSATLAVNPGVDVQRQDRIIDEVTDDVWYVSWVRGRQGLGLDRMVAGLIAVTGSV